MKKIKHVFTETGEVRDPKPNEHFLMDEYLPKSVIASWDGRGDILNSYPILTYERIIEDWKPEENSLYFSINNFLKIYEYAWKNSIVDNDLYESGNCFPTKELAEEKLKQIKDILKGVTQ